MTNRVLLKIVLVALCAGAFTSFMAALPVGPKQGDGCNLSDANGVFCIWKIQSGNAHLKKVGAKEVKTIAPFDRSQGARPATPSIQVNDGDSFWLDATATAKVVYFARKASTTGVWRGTITGSQLGEESVISRPPNLQRYSKSEMAQARALLRLAGRAESVALSEISLPQEGDKVLGDDLCIVARMTPDDSIKSVHIYVATDTAQVEIDGPTGKTADWRGAKSKLVCIYPSPSQLMHMKGLLDSEKSNLSVNLAVTLSSGNVLTRSFLLTFDEQDSLTHLSPVFIHTAPDGDDGWAEVCLSFGEAEAEYSKSEVLMRFLKASLTTGGFLAGTYAENHSAVYAQISDLADLALGEDGWWPLVSNVGTQ